MDFNVIEGLTEEQIKELYNDLVEKNENNLISGAIFEVRCSDGRTGYYAMISDYNSRVGAESYYCDREPGHSMYDHCNGTWGYTRVVAVGDLTNKFQFFKVECNNGVVGYYLDTLNSGIVGNGIYSKDYLIYQSRYELCGGGGWGYSTVINANR